LNYVSEERNLHGDSHEILRHYAELRVPDPFYDKAGSTQNSGLQERSKSLFVLTVQQLDLLNSALKF
jgi:hypothetical protein